MFNRNFALGGKRGRGGLFILEAKSRQGQGYLFGILRAFTQPSSHIFQLLSKAGPHSRPLKIVTFESHLKTCPKLRTHQPSAIFSAMEAISYLIRKSGDQGIMIKVSIKFLSASDKVII